MKRLIRKATPNVGETVELTDDSRYTSNQTVMLSRLDRRDAPVVVAQGKVYYGENGSTTHQELLAEVMQENGLDEDDYIPDLAFAYYVENFLEAPSVFVFEDQNYDNQAGTIKSDRPELAVYIVNNDQLNRVANKKK